MNFEEYGATDLGDQTEADSRHHQNQHQQTDRLVQVHELTAERQLLLRRLGGIVWNLTGNEARNDQTRDADRAQQMQPLHRTAVLIVDAAQHLLERLATGVATSAAASVATAAAAAAATAR